MPETQVDNEEPVMSLALRWGSRQMVLTTFGLIADY